MDRGIFSEASFNELPPSEAKINGPVGKHKGLQ